ncbi:ATP-binding protein, partial [Streptomyces noursei]
MSTTRPYPPGDLGPEPGGAGASAAVPTGQIRRLRLAGTRGAVAR